MRIESKLVSGIVGGESHSIAITEFVDKYFIIISNNGKIGSLVEVYYETDVMKTSPLMNSKTLFGVDKPEILAVAQSMVEMLEIKKPVVFGFSLREYSAETTASMIKLISQTMKKNEISTT